ncbi:MAG: hypothetical protein IPK84_02165 [Candidatus Moraniibacteriota bacterium]|nr:MAG: hypothetical protein IPK84_02165 [Candidatus Moranbacteria bacterium]
MKQKVLKTNLESLKYLRFISWGEVFDTWRELEAWQELWKAHWTERGFESWDEWRHAYAKPLHPEALDWQLYHLTHPLADSPLLYGTPTTGWIKKAYQGKITKQLKDLVRLPIISQNEKIRDIQRAFPEETQLTGIVHNGNVILIEGMHRAAALASWNSDIPFAGKVTLALAEWTEAVPALGGNYKMPSRE